MSEALQRQGHRCDVVHSLAEAETRLQQKSYDVVVTDLVMEGKRDGLELLKKAKTLNPPPQVILVTCGNTSNARLRRLIETAWPAMLPMLERGEPLVELGTDPNITDRS